MQICLCKYCLSVFILSWRTFCHFLICFRSLIRQILAFSTPKQVSATTKSNKHKFSLLSPTSQPQRGLDTHRYHCWVGGEVESNRAYVTAISVRFGYLCQQLSSQSVLRTETNKMEIIDYKESERCCLHLYLSLFRVWWLPRAGSIFDTFSTTNSSNWAFTRGLRHHLTVSYFGKNKIHKKMLKSGKSVEKAHHEHSQALNSI